MAHYMLMAAYKPEVLATMVQDPDLLMTREQHADAFYGAVGGKVINKFFVRNGRHHFMIIVDFPSDEAAHAAMMAGAATGAFTEMDAIPLSTMREAEKGIHVAAEASKAFYEPADAPEKS